MWFLYHNKILHKLVILQMKKLISLINYQFFVEVEISKDEIYISGFHLSRNDI